MKKIIKYLLIILLLTTTSCSSNNNNNSVEFDKYASIKMFSDNEEIEFIAKLDAHDSILDCAYSHNVEVNRDYYYGMSYSYAFGMFYEHVSDKTSVDDNDIEIHVEKDYLNEFEKNIDEIKNSINSDIEISLISDTEQYFENNFNKYLKSVIEFDGKNNDGQYNPQEDPDVVLNIKDVTRDYIEKKSNDTYVIDVDKLNEYKTFDATDLNIEIKGTLPIEPTLEIYNAAHVDVSKIIFDENAETITNKEPIRIKNTSYKNVELGDIMPREEIDRPESETFIKADISDDGNEIIIGINYMSEEEIERKRQEDINFLNEVFEKGIYKDENGNNYGFITSDIDLDIGDVILPNSDYSTITVAGNGKLKLRGTITVTGGSLGFGIRDNGQLDLSDLYIIKSHPSPDMLFLDYPEDYEGDKELFKAKTTKGEIQYEYNETRFKISIW